MQDHLLEGGKVRLCAEILPHALQTLRQHLRSRQRQSHPEHTY